MRARNVFRSSRPVLGPALGALAAALAVGAPARAEEPNEGLGLDRRIDAPTRAFELGLGLGYSQPFGDIQSGAALRDITAAGALLELDLGYRASPELGIGAYASGAKYTWSRGLPFNSDVWSATAGVRGSWHARPARGLDPWVALGTGWRALWVAEPGLGTNTRHGWEIARAEIGIDVRAGPAFAISPIIGADLSIFLSESPYGMSTWRSIPGRLNTFVFAGVGGRFDFGFTEAGAR